MTDYEKEYKKAQRRTKLQEMKDWCLNHLDVTIGAFCAGMGLLSTGVKVGGKVIRKHQESRDKDYRCYDPSLGRYWNLKRKLNNRDWLAIERRKAKGEHMGEILEDLGALR